VYLCVSAGIVETTVQAVRKLFEEHIEPLAKFDRAGLRFREDFLWRAEVSRSVDVVSHRAACACVHDTAHGRRR
jgi:hypothetical protein